jgi:hypothetical protein
MNGRTFVVRELAVVRKLPRHSKLSCHNRLPCHSKLPFHGKPLPIHNMNEANGFGSKAALQQVQSAQT